MKKNILLILLSVILIFASIKEVGYFFISIPSFFLLSYNLSDIIVKINSKRSRKLIGGKFEYIFLPALICVLVFGKYYENTLGGYELFWKLAFSGLILNILTIFVLSFFYSFDSVKKVYNILSLCIFFTLLVSSLGVFINYKFAASNERQERIEINKKYINNGSKGGKSYEIFIKTKYDNDERLSISKELYDNISNNQLIELTLSEGALGYDYVKKIKKINIYR